MIGRGWQLLLLVTVVFLLALLSVEVEGSSGSNKRGSSRNTPSRKSTPARPAAAAAAASSSAAAAAATAAQSESSDSSEERAPPRYIQELSYHILPEDFRQNASFLRLHQYLLAPESRQFMYQVAAEVYDELPLAMEEIFSTEERVDVLLYYNAYFVRRYHDKPVNMIFLLNFFAGPISPKLEMSSTLYRKIREDVLRLEKITRIRNAIRSFFELFTFREGDLLYRFMTGLYAAGPNSKELDFASAGLTGQFERFRLAVANVVAKLSLFLKVLEEHEDTPELIGHVNEWVIKVHCARLQMRGLSVTQVSEHLKYAPGYIKINVNFPFEDWKPNMSDKPKTSRRSRSSSSSAASSSKSTGNAGGSSANGNTDEKKNRKKNGEKAVMAQKNEIPRGLEVRHQEIFQFSLLLLLLFIAYNSFF